LAERKATSIPEKKTENANEANTPEMSDKSMFIAFAYANYKQKIKPAKALSPNKHW
jgi:hypothetical protein